MTTDTTAHASVTHTNIWRADAGLLLLGLCPLLAVTTTLVNGLALGVATTLVLVVSNLLTSLVRRVLIREIRLLFYVLVIGTAVTVIDRLMAGLFFRLHLGLGIFVPLIAANCLLVARAELCASRSGVGAALRDALRTGGGFVVALVLLGALREAIGSGTILADAELLFGPGAADWSMRFADGFLLAVLPPGAFLTLAFVIAAHRALRARHRDA